MKVIEFTSDTMQGLEEKFGMSRIWAEVNNEGKVLREIGFASDGTIAHKFPGVGKFGKYGVFDLAVVASQESDVSHRQFEALWDS